MNWEAALDQLTAAPLAAYALYWSILIGVAALEMIGPARAARAPLGPRLTANFALGLMTMALLSLPLLSGVAVAQWASTRGWGLLHRTGLAVGWQVGLSFLVYDLCGYIIHRASHRVGWLWRLHRVHHSDSDLDLSTYFRAHPLEVLVVLGFTCPLIVTLGLHPAALVLHGLGKQLTMAFGHANIAPRPRLSRIVARLFVSPAFHEAHHSAHRPDTDSNYGEVLTIWDQLFGSVGKRSDPVERFGLGDSYDRDSASLLAQLRLPFVSR